MATKKYDLDKRLERAAVAFAVTDPRFYGSIGHAIEAALLPNENAQYVMKARHEIAKTSKGAPCSSRLIAQRFKTWRAAGTLTLEECNDAYDWLEAAIDGGDADKEGVSAAVIEVLRFAINTQAVEMAMTLHAKRKTDMSAVAALFEKAKRLGVWEQPKALDFECPDILNQISTGKQDRLPTGISELDDSMDGGLGRGELGFCIGGTGDGKSMFLSQVTASALYSRRGTLVVTLELSNERWSARLLSAMTDIPVRTILDACTTPEQKERIETVRAYAGCKVVSMTAGLATASDIWALFDEINEERKREGKPPLEVVIVDYADRLGIPDGGDRYEGALYQYEPLRLGAAERKAWCWTASAAKALNTQTVGRKKRKARDGSGEDDIAIRGVESAADSQNKARVSDVVVTLNASENKKRTRVALVKNRNGEVGFASAIMETDYAFGRLTMADWSGGAGRSAGFSGLEPPAEGLFADDFQW